MTFIGPPERGGDPLRAVHGGRLQNMIDIFESTGRGQPKVFAIDLPSWRYKKGDTLFALRNSDRVLTRNGLSQPLMVVETFYDDPEAAREVARFRAESTRPVPEVLQWPRRRDRRCTPGFGISPPYQADAYVKAVTGKAPSMTLKARVGRLEGHAADAAGAGSQRAPGGRLHDCRGGYLAAGRLPPRGAEREPQNVPGVQRPCDVGREAGPGNVRVLVPATARRTLLLRCASGLGETHGSIAVDLEQALGPRVEAVVAGDVLTASSAKLRPLR